MGALAPRRAAAVSAQVRVATVARAVAVGGGGGGAASILKLRAELKPSELRSEHTSPRVLARRKISQARHWQRRRQRSI